MIYKGEVFLILLILICIILFLLNFFFVKYYKKKHKYSKQILRKLSFVYIFVYAIASGFLIYYGLNSLKKLLEIYIKNKNLVDLISVSIIISFSFIYSALFQDILENFFGEIKIKKWDNVISYIFGRFIIILILYFFFIQKK